MTNTLGRNIQLRILLYRIAVYPEGPCDGGLVHYLLRQGVDGLKQGLARNLTVQPQPRQWRQGLTEHRNMLNDFRASVDYSNNEVFELLQRVTDRFHLDQGGSRTFDGVGVLAAAVAAYYRYARRLLELDCERLGAPVYRGMQWC